MDRRLVGIFVVCVLCGSVAGCVGVSETVDQNRHPFADQTVTVAVDGTDREQRLVAEALAYWAGNASEYAGFDVQFNVRSLTPTADGETDVQMRFVESVADCGDSDYPAGCAPVLAADSRLDRPADVQIERGFDDDSTRLVVRHEVGHLLGLGHDDQPQAVMRHERALATLPQPNATERQNPWGDNELSVAVLEANVSADERDQFREEVSYALTYVRAGADGTVPANLTLQRVSNTSTADIVVRSVESADCRDETGSCRSVEGPDPDYDGAIETYSHAEISLVSLDTDVVSWHLARQLLGVLGVEDVPDRLTESTYRERRGDW